MHTQRVTTALTVGFIHLALHPLAALVGVEAAADLLWILGGGSVCTPARAHAPLWPHPGYIHGE